VHRVSLLEEVREAMQRKYSAKKLLAEVVEIARLL